MAGRADPRLAVHVLTGVLGAGKTTLLGALFRRPERRRSAVIINEFGEIALDHELVEHSREEIVEVKGGCLCCTIRGHLGRAIRSLNPRRIKGEVLDFERLLIETTGLADPAPILHTLMTDPVIAHDFRLAGVPRSEPARRRIPAFCLRRETPVAAAALELFLDLLIAQCGPDLLRLKGIVAVAGDPDRPLVLHGVRHLLHEPVTLDAWPSADRATRLVLITRDLPAEPIERLLTALGSVAAATAPPDPR
jgi:G3E family GTPase